MSDAYGNIIPARWIMPTRATKFEQLVIVNWLQTELPATSRIARRTSRLTGWRNYEVYWYIRSIDWTASMFVQ
jgi:hypothetical protein